MRLATGGIMGPIAAGIATAVITFGVVSSAPRLAAANRGGESRLTGGVAGGQLSATAAELHAQFERRVADIASRVDGVVGYSILDLTSGDRVARLENAMFPTASTIKLAVVYELFKQVEERTIRLDEMVPLDRTKAVGGTGVLQQLGTPTLSVRDYATLMVMLSDNTATNVLIDRLTLEKINSRLTSLGLSATKLRRRMMDTESARRGDENVSSPADIVRLLGIMVKEQPEAVALLEKPKESRLRRGLPERVDTADKPGELEGVRVDAGIVFAKGRPYILCVMTTFLKTEAEGERAIEEISRTAYEYFRRLGAGGALGRQLKH
jgi:beta-lactamase class A